MKRYSVGMDTTFMAKVTKIASSVEKPSTMAMPKGPKSLQMRSMRRICEFITAASNRNQFVMPSIHPKREKKKKKKKRTQEQTYAAGRLDCHPQ